MTSAIDDHNAQFRRITATDPDRLAAGDRGEDASIVDFGRLADPLADAREPEG